MKIYILVFLLSFQLWGFDKNYNPTTAHKVEHENFNTICDEPFLPTELLDGKVYMHIPETALGKPMLFVNHRDGYKHYYKQVIWKRFNDKIILESPRVISETGVIIPINNNASIIKNNIGIFPIIKDKSGPKRYCIDITNLFLSKIVDWDSNFKETIVSNLSYITEVKHLENEVIVKTSRVIMGQKEKFTISMDFSFYLLPKPMKPRLYDYRMGFFAEDNRSIINHTKASGIASIMRWRLEKKHQNKEVSVPVKPITFMLSSDIPKKYRPYVKAGIMEWLPAFEAAGFKNALIIREETSENEEIPNNSVKYSIVRWGNRRYVRRAEDKMIGSTVSNIVDFRSGEILKGDIIIGAPYEQLSDSYFIRCAPMDKRAQQYPFPDDLVGELIQYVVAHETGHAFGIRDANYGEYAYPFEKMRDENWLRKMGHTPSIMTYARHNYIVQPEDDIDSSLLIQKVGPTDIYNIQWAYTPFKSNENQHLENLVRLQDSIPWYRYYSGGSETIGPGMSNEVVDNNDPIKSTEMGLKNMKRVIALLPEINHDKKDFALMKRLYSKTLDLWYEQMKHVMSLIGGYTIQNKSGSQLGDIYTPISYNTQIEAMGFLFSQAFEPPKWLVEPESFKKISYSTYPDKVSELQLKLLLKLLSPQRIKRMEYMEYSRKYKGLSKRFLSKIQISLFKELYTNKIIIDSRKQELQSVYIDKLSKVALQERKHLETSKNLFAYTNHSKSLFMNKLLDLKNLISNSLKKNMNELTLGHLKLILRRIENFERKI